MTNLELQIQALKGSLGLDDEKAKAVEIAIRSYAITVLNLAQYLREKNVDMEAARGVMETHGIGYDGKTRKFK